MMPVSLGFIQIANSEVVCTVNAAANSHDTPSINENVGI